MTTHDEPRSGGKSGASLSTAPPVASARAGAFLDGVEAIANAVVGLGVSVVTVYALWPVFGWAASVGQSAAVTAVFFAMSAVRAYAIRRVFRWLS